MITRPRANNLCDASTCAHMLVQTPCNQPYNAPNRPKQASTSLDLYTVDDADCSNMAATRLTMASVNQVQETPVGSTRIQEAAWHTSETIVNEGSRITLTDCSKADRQQSN